MKNIFINKIITSTLIFTLVLSFLSFYPRKVKALVSIVNDPPNTIQSIINVFNTTATSFSNYSMKFKEYVLDPLASGMAKMIIRSLTTSVVNWINSGFKGSPAFIQNPGTFFLDLADQITGDFLSKTGGPLVNLCSPFSIDIRIALAFKYHPNIPQRYKCTLGTIITNSKNAVKNASINGFTAGDFKQGGWPAFVSLTTEPQNNIYGAYLTAESELSWRVAQAQNQQRDELTQGKGFLSWKKCTKTGVENTAERADQGTGEGNYTGPERSFEGTGEGYVPEEKCEIQTPGSVIAGSLENSLGGPLRELELADELNEIVNALFAQLVTQVLQAGLGGVSHKDSSGKSYLDQTVSDIYTENSPQVQSARNDILSNIAPYIRDTETYKKFRDDALKVMLDVKNAFDSVKSCYAGKVGLTTPQTNEAQLRINAIDEIINLTVAPTTAHLISLAQEADNRLAILIRIRNEATAAKTLNDLNKPSQEFSGLIQNQNLTSPKDIQDATEGLSAVEANSVTIKQDVMRAMQKCQLFPNG